MNDKAPFIWFLHDAFRVCKDGGAALIFSRWDVANIFTDAMRIAGFQIKSCIVWDKCSYGMGDLKASFAPSHEVILFGVKGKFSFPGKRPKDVLHFPKVSNDKMIHPNEKPVELLKSLIESTTKKDAIVLDPFMGSGSSGVAAMKLERKFIGCELDENYFKISKDRIESML